MPLRVENGYPMRHWITRTGNNESLRQEDIEINRSVVTSIRTIRLASAILLLMSSASSAGHPEDVLLPCPASPNCVSSLATDPRHAIEPFTFETPPDLAWERLKTVLGSEKRVTIPDEKGGYLRAEFRSLVFRFVDDVEFVLVPDQRLIHVRSASRTGHSDFGVNRKRIERLRARFSAPAAK